MKNIHVLPTDKPSRLTKALHYNNRLRLVHKNYKCNIKNEQYQNIYITSEEEIKEGDWIFANQGVHKVIDIKNDKYPYGTLNHKGDKIYHHKSWKKIILTTDQDLIKDDVQEISDEFLEWFVKNPSCEEVEVKSEILYEHKDTYRPYPSECKNLTKTKVNYYLSIIPKEEPKQETVEEAALNYCKGMYKYNINHYTNIFTAGAKWQQERMYSEEDMIEFAWWLKENMGQFSCDRTAHFNREYFKLWKEQQPKTIYYNE